MWAESDDIFARDNRDLFLQAEVLAVQAIALDSNFAWAHATLMQLRQILDSDYLVPIERMVSLRDGLGSDLQFLIDLTEQSLDKRDPRATLEILEPLVKLFELPGLAQTFFTEFTQDEIASLGALVNHVRSVAYGGLGDRIREIELLDLNIRDADVLPYTKYSPGFLSQYGSGTGRGGRPCRRRTSARGTQTTLRVSSRHPGCRGCRGVGASRTNHP